MSSRLIAAQAAILVLLLILVGPARTAVAKVFLSQQEALELAFPDADEIRSDIRILTTSQSERIKKIARSDLDTEIIKLYSGWMGDRLLGYAYIDVHTVRTMPEAFLVVLTPDGVVRSLRVLAFHEPLDYMPNARWYRQFDGVEPGRKLRVGQDIHGILGATLSARAVAASVRRVQAFYEVLVVHPRPVASRPDPDPVPDPGPDRLAVALDGRGSVE